MPATTFEFVCAEHQEFGGNGWRLKSQPDFDPLPGMAVAHDCLEHFTDSAAPADEFLALGASMWIRNEDYHARTGKAATDPGKHISADLPDILRHVIYEGYRLTPAPRTRATDEELEHQIDIMFNEYRKELEYMDDTKMRLDADQKRSIRSYLRIGYRRAIKRYRDRQYEAGQLFADIEKRADQYLKQAEGYGEELHVTVDFQKLTASVEMVFEEDTYDYGEEEGND